LTLAALYERQGDFKRVEEVCRQGLLGNPSATEIADRLLKFLTGRGRYADAENVLRQIQNPRIVTDWQVRLAIGTGDFSRAIEGLRLKISNDKQDAASRVELARLLYQQTKDAAQALRYLDEAKAINPRSGTLVAVRASILKAESKSAEALRVLDDYVANYDNFDAYWMRAVYLAEGGDLEHAGQDYRKLTTFKGQEAAGYELLGNFLASTGKLDQAVTTVKEALGAHPEELRLRRRLMLLLLARNLPGDKEEALAILKELEKQLPGDSELMLAHAVEKIREGTPQSIAEAKGILENIVKRQPTTVAAYLYLINIAMQERQYQAACDCAIRALESNPNNSMLLLARAGAELALGYAPMAAKLARQVLQQDPNSIEASDAFVQAALQAALSNNDPSILGEARKLTDDAVRRNPANERLLLSRAHFYAGLKEPRGAIPQLEAYCRTKDGSSSVAALLTLADLYRMGGDAAPADKTLSQVEQLDAHNPLVVHARVLWLISQNRLDDLKGISAAYLAAKPQDPDMLLRAASTLAPLNVPEIQKERIKLLEQAASLAAKTQELAMLLRVASTLSSSSSMELQNEAVKLLEQAASLATSDTNVQVALASTLYQTGNVDRAKKIYQELLRQQPKNVQVLNNLAWVLQEHDHDYSAALELADKGMMIARDDIHLLDTRGTILMNMPGRLSDAKKDYERLLQVSSSDDRWQAKTLLQLGRICAKLNDVPQAKQNLQKAVEINKTLNIFTPDERVEIEKILAPPEK
jgi:tetratricopeptide (TPR) repeat protein